VSSRGPLSHLTVVDLSQHVAGPYVTKLMAGFGARVLKIEPPGSGDPLRARGPFAGDRPGAERGLPFLWLNTGKKSVTLNLETAEGRALVADLLRQADVVVDSFPPGGMERLGLDDATLASLNPRLVRTSVTGFGSSGPYKDYEATEAVLYALSGGMVSTGDPGRAPLRPGPSITQYTAGMYAYIGTLMALYRRETTGRGERVEVSIQESALENIEVHLAEQIHLGQTARRTNDQHAMVPWQCHPCADGRAAIIGGPIRRWLGAATLFEEPRLLEEPHRDMGGRIRNRRDFEALIAPWLARHGKEQVFHEGQKRGLAFGYLATVAEAMRSPQHEARGFFRTVEHPEAGALTLCGPPFRMERDAWADARAPLLGEHNDEVFEGLLRRAPEEIARLRSEGVI
jgi:crotonobetainyl-CoA:carnitine CoA-transferase CaiB-like acyl-CoA transferase